jgi:predicted MPP superfamily phosphohydrolase
VDFVVITGDFITGRKQYARRVARVLRRLKPKIACLAVLGNHDYGIFHPRGMGGVRGLAEYLSGQLKQANVQVMLNESRAFTRGGDWLQFVGVEDFWSPRFDPLQAFEAATMSMPTVALCHNPDAAMQLASHGAQWTLAGHTHGRPLPGMVMPSDHRHFFAGEYELGKNRMLYVNRGISYGRRRNLNARPEITLFTLRCA